MRKIVLVTVIAVFLGGCASAAKMGNMVYQDDDTHRSYDPALMNAVTLEKVTGGKKTNPLWASEISSDAFQDALSQTLKNEGLYAENGPFHLNVELLHVDRPIAGLHMTSTTYVDYILTDSNSGTLVMRDQISAPQTVKFKEALIAVTRQRMANEKSAKKNIELFLGKLAKLVITKSE